MTPELELHYRNLCPVLPCSFLEFITIHNHDSPTPFPNKFFHLYFCKKKKQQQSPPSIGQLTRQGLDSPSSTSHVPNQQCQKAVGTDASFSQGTITNAGLGKRGKPGWDFITEKSLKTSLLWITGVFEMQERKTMPSEMSPYKRCTCCWLGGGSGRNSVLRDQNAFIRPLSTPEPRPQ